MAWVLSDVVTPNAAAQRLTADDGAKVTIVNRLVGLRSATRLSSKPVRNAGAGEVMTVLGKSANGLWWRVSVPEAPGGAAWLYALYGVANAAADATPVIR